MQGACLRKDVEKIQATHAAFAALTKSGDVVAWGDPFAGGDASAVKDQLKNVNQIQAWLVGSERKASLEHGILISSVEHGASHKGSTVCVTMKRWIAYAGIIFGT